MSADFIALPEAQRFAFTNAALPANLLARPVAGKLREGLVRAHIIVAGDRIEAIRPAHEDVGDIAKVDLAGGMIFPCFTDMHTHLDKGHTSPRNPNPDGSFAGAIEAVTRDRITHWSAEDVAARMDFSLRTAFAHGTQLIRTHLDALAPQHRISFEVFESARERWRGRIDLQAVALFPLDLIADEAFFHDLVEVVTTSGGLLGGVTYLHPHIEQQLDALFAAAARAELDIDLHVDETEDREVLTLEAIARAKLRHGFKGAVTVGHCCSLARQDEATAKRVIDLVAQAEISVVSLPMCNMYLQDRHAGRTPRWRGVTLFHELAAAGVRTAVSSDNTRDPFYAYGDLDPVEVLREAVRILHLDHPLDTAGRVVTHTPADILGHADKGLIAVGGKAELVVFRARRWSELLSRPQSDRVVLRGGRAIDRVLPDYSELDDLLGVSHA
ncbi:cytosine deaminase [Oryzibacter oryziterrae]|uniref:cytosine deaminase n=1 Tax=Oryzibacter oryziterrae TaxID=2766474 RepID=UPI001EFFB182|nr:cytosine deaminase [Oryzibacter oryziterrae]